MRAALAILILLAQEPAKPEAPKAEPPKEAKPEKKPVYSALVGGDVHTVSRGVLKGATVLIKDGKIHRVGQGLDLPEGTTQIDVSGKRVLPGFVAASVRNLGVVNVSGKFADSVDPFHEPIKLALAGGITTAYVEAGGGGGFFGGGAPSAAPGAVLKLSYGTLEGMVLLEPAAVPLSGWVSGGAAERYDLRENFQKARAHLEKEREFEKRRAENQLKPNEQPPRASGFQETLVKLLKGETLARMPAPDAESLRKAIELVEEFKFKAVFTHVVEGWTVAEEIGRARAYCLFSVRSKEHAPRNAARPAGSSIEQAAILKRAGVKFAILPPTPGVGTGGIAGRDYQTLPLEAAFAIRGGLDEETALRSITLTAAEICGVDHRVGSIDEGKDADLIVLDGDPFDYRTFVEMTFVDGKLLYEKAKSPYFSHLKRAEPPKAAESPKK